MINTLFPTYMYMHYYIFMLMFSVAQRKALSIHYAVAVSQDFGIFFYETESNFFYKLAQWRWSVLFTYEPIFALLYIPFKGKC